MKKRHLYYDDRSWRDLDKIHGNREQIQFGSVQGGKIIILNTLATLKAFQNEKEGVLKTGARLPYARCAQPRSITRMRNASIQTDETADVIQTSLTPKANTNRAQTYKEETRQVIPTTAIVHSQLNNNKQATKNLRVKEDTRQMITTTAIVHSPCNNNKQATKNLRVNEQTPNTKTVSSLKLQRKLDGPNATWAVTPTNRDTRTPSKAIKRRMSTACELNDIQPQKKRRFSTALDRRNSYASDPVKCVTKPALEVIVDDHKIDLIRTYLTKKGNNFDLLRFDEGGHYQIECLLRFTPVVRIERCQEIQRRLRKDSQDDISLKDFVSKLGLQNVLEKPMLQRYNMRKTVRQNVRNVNKVTEYIDLNSDSEENTQNRTNDKNNNMTDSDNSHKELSRPAKSIIKPTSKVKSSKKKIKNTVPTDSLDFSDDGEQEMKKNKITDKIKSLSAKKAASRASSLLRIEYSNLEDHAIVAWVSNGGRARLVNGNRIWQELAEQYQKLTGVCRTYQSLRNRYLRSILPSLESMALDTVLASRLRAAAATGELKSRTQAGRRNSIFGVPARGALSRRVQRTRSEDLPSPKRRKIEEKPPAPAAAPARVLRSSASPARSPRYSDITRRFAAKHILDTDTDTSTE